MGASHGFTTIDYVVIAIYFAVIIAEGIRVSRATHDGEDLFLAGRSLTFGLIGFSLFASNISSTTLIGLSGAAYTDGIATANYEWMAGVVLVFMAMTYLPLYLRAQITTVPEYLERRFNRACRRYFSALTIFLTIVVDTAGGLYAGALTLQVFFPGLEIWQTVIAVALFCGIYTAAGGLAAVVHTDLVQALVLITGSCVLTVMLFGRLDYSWAQLTHALPEDHLSLILPMDSDVLPGLGTLIGVPILGFWYWATNQYITQRLLGAKSLEHARSGALLGGALKLLPLFIMVLPGAMARVVFPDIERGDLVFPTLIRDVLPAGVAGLVMAGLFAAIMSSIDSALNSCSTLAVYDFTEVGQRDDDASRRRALRIGRLATFLFMTVAALWAPMIASFQGLFNYLQQAFAILVPPVAAVFLLGAFTRRGNGTTGLMTLLLGHALAAVFFVAAQLEVWTLHFTITAGIVTGLCCLLFLVLARVHPPPADGALERTVFDASTLSVPEGTPWYRDYRVHAGTILLLTALMLVAFW